IRSRNVTGVQTCSSDLFKRQQVHHRLYRKKDIHLKSIRWHVRRLKLMVFMEAIKEKEQKRLSHHPQQQKSLAVLYLVKNQIKYSSYSRITLKGSLQQV